MRKAETNKRLSEVAFALYPLSKAQDLQLLRKCDMEKGGLWNCLRPLRTIVASEMVLAQSLSRHDFEVRGTNT